MTDEDELNKIRDAKVSVFESVMNYPGQAETQAKVVRGLEHLIAQIKAGQIVAVMCGYTYYDGTFASTDYQAGISTIDSLARVGLASFMRAQTLAWAVNDNERETGLASKWSKRLAEPPCALCDSEEPATIDSLLCADCHRARMEAASLDRIARGEGLTYSNSERFSEENWIKANKPAEPLEAEETP